MTARWILSVFVCLVALPALADHKYGKQVRYLGSHPIPNSEGGGMCYIDGPHVHTYATNKLEYRTTGDDHVFVGDPVAHGWDGPKFAYKGPHPIRVEGDPHVEYCYIAGPHFHQFAPPEGPDFKVVGDAYFYVGEPPRAMIDARPLYVGINDFYRPMVYERPVVEVAPPEGWVGVRAGVAAPGVGAEPACRHRSRRPRRARTRPSATTRSASSARSTAATRTAAATAEMV